MKRILALRVQQPLGEFFVTTMRAVDLIGRVTNKPRSSAGSSNQGIQRVFNDRRVRDISNFCDDVQATFPTPIILAVSSGTITEVEVDTTCLGLIDMPFTCFEIPAEGTIGDVLDGQHRILGLESSDARDHFDLSVVLMFDLEPEDKAFVFSIINSTQTPVKASLIYDLFELSSYRSPQKTAHFVAQSLNIREGSPFRGRLKMLGQREKHHKQGVMLTQGSFGARLVDLISKDPAEDARLLKEANGKDSPKEDSRCPLRKYFLAGDDESIYKIVLNFFSAVAEAFAKEWDDESGAYVIRKTVGYTALIIVLRHLMEVGFQSKTLSKPFFAGEVARLKANLGNRPLTVDEFPSSGAGAVSLARVMLGLENLRFKAVAGANTDPSSVTLEA